jgi:hypothetical protein
MLEPIDFWKFHDTLNVYQATYLILNLDPSQGNHLKHNDSISYETILIALQKDIRSEKLWANIVHDYDNQYSRNEPEIYWDKTTIGVSMLKEWLISKNCKPSFFFSIEANSEPDYLNKNHPRYSAKLAASVKVWLAMEDDNLIRGKTPKTAMESFLTNNYKEFGLIHNQDSSNHGYKKGDINKGAITEIAKIANWNDKGGAPSTPLSEPIPTLVDIDFIDEIPF